MNHPTKEQLAHALTIVAYKAAIDASTILYRDRHVAGHEILAEDNERIAHDAARAADDVLGLVSL